MSTWYLLERNEGEINKNIIITFVSYINICRLTNVNSYCYYYEYFRLLKCGNR